MNTLPPITPEEADRRLREAILYVAGESLADVHFGATKLNKLLFYADFLTYRDTGRSITGQEYMRLKNGPVPKRLKSVREQMVIDGDCVIIRRPTGIGFRPQERIEPRRNADMREFSGDEVARLQSVITHFREWHGQRMSNATHGFVGWQVFADRETIPYETVFVCTGPLSQAEKDHALTLG